MKSFKAHVVGAFQTHFATGSVDRFGTGLNNYIQAMRSEKFELYRQNVFVEATLAEWLREEVDGEDNQKYVITALFAETIHAGDALILDPSVRHFGGWNMAVFGKQFDTKFEVLATFVVSIEKSYHFGLRDLRYISHGRSIDADGTIVWDEKLEVKTFHANASDNRAERIGWRKKREHYRCDDLAQTGKHSITLHD
ncbi:hypothetical protein [Massilia eurypsychrophila]|uniref:hypothetical protein n=1 Tax=Massilia eurypsychrophila TaxID=1485217 RepID=UPI0010353BDF|nr:hypothetical protein [Massilia eurypsychrophila]